MKRLLPALFALGLYYSEATAQQVIPPLRHEFLDSAWQVLPSAAGARYRRETEWRDSTAGEVRDYYLSSNQLQSRGQVANPRAVVAHGTQDTWYPNGQLESHAEYRYGRPVGEWLLYYPGGQRQARYQYATGPTALGVLESSECFNLNGQPMPCPVVRETMPVYSEGDGSAQAVVETVARNFRYPRQARRTGEGGRILVGFKVSEQGEVIDVRIEQSVSPLLDAAALKAVQQLRRFRPGTQDGRPVTVKYSVPLTLRVQ